MNSIEIKGVKSIMTHILTRETFDSFTISEARVRTFVTYTIDGTFQPDFFTEEEKESDNFPTETFVRYASVRKFLFEIIKGKRTPTYMKLVFHAPSLLIERLIEKSGSTFTKDDVNSLTATVSFRGGKVTIVTGTNYRVFSPDRSLDEAWDIFFERFLTKNNIDF